MFKREVFEQNAFETAYDGKTHTLYLEYEVDDVEIDIGVLTSHAKDSLRDAAKPLADGITTALQHQYEDSMKTIKIHFVERAAPQNDDAFDSPDFRIRYDQFAKMLDTLPGEARSPEEKRQLFNIMDVDKQRYLSFHKYLRWLEIREAQQQLNTDVRDYMVARGAVVIRFLKDRNLADEKLNSFLSKQGLTEDEIHAATQRFEKNPDSIPMIDLKTASIDESVIMKTMKRVGVRLPKSKNFDDFESVKVAGRGVDLERVYFYVDKFAKFLTGFQADYKTVSGMRSKAELRLSPKHIMSRKVLLNLEPGECIQRVDVFGSSDITGGRAIDGLTVYTTKRLFPVGLTNGEKMGDITAPKGSHIISFYGSFSAETSRLESLAGHIVIRDSSTEIKVNKLKGAWVWKKRRTKEEYHQKAIEVTFGETIKITLPREASEYFLKTGKQRIMGFWRALEEGSFNIQLWKQDKKGTVKPKTQLGTINVVNPDRANWDVGSELQVYSKSKGEWYGATVIKVAKNKKGDRDEDRLQVEYSIADVKTKKFIHRGDLKAARGQPERASEEDDHHITPVPEHRVSAIPKGRAAKPKKIKIPSIKVPVYSPKTKKRQKPHLFDANSPQAACVENLLDPSADKHANFKLDLNQFKAQVENMGIALSEERIKQCFTEYDFDKSGDIDYQEFMHFLRSYQIKNEQDEEIRPDKVTRATQVISYSKKQRKAHRKTRSELTHFLISRGLHKAEINAAFAKCEADDILELNSDHLSPSTPHMNLVLPFQDERLLRILRIVGDQGEKSKSFTDIDVLRSTGSGTHTKALRVWFTVDRICGLQMIYRNRNGESVQGRPHKCLVPKRAKIDLRLEAGEYIKGVRVSYNEDEGFVSGIIVDTNQRQQQFGRVADISEGNILMAPEGGEVAALYGSKNDKAIDSIGIHVYRRE